MKRNFFKSFLLVAAGAFMLAGSGCKKLEDFGDTNVNPNGSPEVLTSALLTNAESQLGTTVADLNTGQYAQIFAEPTYPGNSLYVLPQYNASGIYAGPLMDLQVIINKNSDPATAGAAAAAGPNASQIAIARILKAYYFWTITDRWGDIPYTEALKGNFTPKYDEQEFIYKDLVKELTEAKDQFDMVGPLVKGDIIYNGNVEKWQRLANSLRMLITLRTSKVYPNPGEWAATEFNAALNSTPGIMDENVDNFSLDFPGGNYRNSFYNFSLSADNRTSLTLTDLITGLGDPRGTAFYSNSSGVPYGLSTAAPTSVDYGKILSTTWHAEGAVLPIITASSILLAKAEAIERGWIPGLTTADAKIAYDRGVTLNFEQWGITMPASYLTSGPANYLTGMGVASIGGSSVTGSNAITDTKLERIHLQQFISFYPNGIQAWSNWRRTGIPDIRPTVNARGGDGIPRRYVYGQLDQNLNSAQLAIAVARIPGGDDQDARMWWDRP